MTARYLFRKVVSWGRSSPAFRQRFPAISRRGQPPEYATPECDDVRQLVTHGKAGERIVRGTRRRRPATDCPTRLSRADLWLYEQHVTPAATPYGCHVNYLVGRASRVPEAIGHPDLRSWSAARSLRRRQDHHHISVARPSAPQPAGDHIWEGVSSAATRSRPHHQRLGCLTPTPRSTVACMSSSVTPT